MEVKLELPKSVDFESRGIEFSFDFADVPADKLSDFVIACVVAGISKAGVDAAASAKGYAEKNGLTEEAATIELVNKRLTVWAKGEWTMRGGGDGLSRVESIAREKVRDTIKGSPNKAKEYKAAKPEDRVAMVEEVWAKQSDEARAGLIEWAKKELIRRQAEAKAKRDAIAAAPDLGIKL